MESSSALGLLLWVTQPLVRIRRALSRPLGQPSPHSPSAEVTSLFFISDHPQFMD